MDFSREMAMIYESKSTVVDTQALSQPSAALETQVLSPSSQRRAEEMTSLVSEFNFSTLSGAPIQFEGNADARMVSYTTNPLDNNGRAKLEEVYRLEAAQENGTDVFNSNLAQAQVKHSTFTLQIQSDDSESLNRKSFWDYSGIQHNPQQQHLNQDQQPRHSDDDLYFGNKNFKKSSPFSEQVDYDSKKMNLPFSPFDRSSNQEKQHSDGNENGYNNNKNNGNNSSNSHNNSNNNYNNSNSNNMQTPPSISGSNSWSGRTRAHRKMARLLGPTCLDMAVKPHEQRPNFGAQTRHQSVVLEPAPFRDVLKVTHQFGSRAFSQESKDSSQTVHEQAKETAFSLSMGDEKIIKEQFMKSQSNIELRGLNVQPSLTDGPLSSSQMQRDPSLLGNTQFATSAPIDIELSQTLSLESSQDDLFPQPMDSQQMVQVMPFTDSLAAQNTSEMSLESYLNGASDKELDLMPKYSEHPPKDLGTAYGDFDFDDYIDNSRLQQSYIDRSSNLPQDMTTNQKPGQDKFIASNISLLSSSRPKEQDTVSSKMFNKQTGDFSNQRENNRMSTKESHKGIRIPRDITRAMEILQESEREEERGKILYRQETFCQPNQQQQNQHKQQVSKPQILQPQHQQLQSQPPPQNVQGMTINSSPKKTFQTKHQMESSLALAEQSFLGVSTQLDNELADSSASTAHFLDQPMAFSQLHNHAKQQHFQQQQHELPTSAMLCDPSLTDLESYPNFALSSQSSDVDMTMVVKQQETSYHSIGPMLDDMSMNLKKPKDREMGQGYGSSSFPPLASTSSHPNDCMADHTVLSNVYRITSTGLLPNTITTSANNTTVNNFNNSNSYNSSNSSNCDNSNHINNSSITNSSINPDMTPIITNTSNNADDADNDTNSLENSKHGMDSRRQTLYDDLHSKTRWHSFHQSQARECSVMTLKGQNLYSMMKRGQLCDAVIEVAQHQVKVSGIYEFYKFHSNL